LKAGTITRPARDRPGFHFLGGKGGVGKTTCAAAFALLASTSHRRVLVASTDPAPSLADAFALKIGPSPKRVTARVDAVEIDAPPVLRRWIAERRHLLEEIALQGTWLDRDDIGRLLSLSLPGIDEVAALLEISRLARDGRYELIVVDTAPTGHTLRMLSMPETLFGVARVFDAMRQKHRVMVEALRGSFEAGTEDALIDALAAEARTLAGLLRDSERTRISWVTLPEPMAIEETRDALADLAARGLTVRDVVINRVTPKRHTRCAHCEARRAFESRAVQGLRGRLPVREVFASDDEPRGLAALKRIGAQLESVRPPSFDGRRGRTDVVRDSGKFVAQDFLTAVGLAKAASRASVPPSLKLLLFGGKGGVGKTTCAAATAIDLAARDT
jgi:arsenite-transporting ATPase